MTQTVTFLNLPDVADDLLVSVPFIDRADTTLVDTKIEATKRGTLHTGVIAVTAGSSVSPTLVNLKLYKNDNEDLGDLNRILKAEVNIPLSVVDDATGETIVSDDVVTTMIVEVPGGNLLPDAAQILRCVGLAYSAFFHAVDGSNVPSPAVLERNAFGAMNISGS